MNQNIPLHIDVFALIIFLGAVQGLFLSAFFLTKPNRLVKSNVYLGLLLLSASFLSVDILLSYTNYMFRTIYLVDITEPLNFLIGPCFFLFIATKTDPDRMKKVFPHFLPFFIYLIYIILFSVQTPAFKYNSYLEQYHPALPRIEMDGMGLYDPLYFRTFINELTIISIFIYVCLSAHNLYQASKQKEWAQKRRRDLRFLWGDVLFMAVLLFVIIFVKIYFDYDLGDYLIIIVVTLFIYSITIKLIRTSAFFGQPGVNKKYSKSSLGQESKERILEKITELMEKEKYYLESSSLPDLANRVGGSANHVSQVINEKLDMTFPEFLARYRIEEAKKLIADPDTSESIEHIAYRVGYNSKSSFFTSFKKLTGMTPADYKNSLENR